VEDFVSGSAGRASILADDVFMQQTRKDGTVGTIFAIRVSLH